MCDEIISLQGHESTSAYACVENMQTGRENKTAISVAVFALPLFYPPCLLLDQFKV